MSIRGIITGMHIEQLETDIAAKTREIDKMQEQLDSLIESGWAPEMNLEEKAAGIAEFCRNMRDRPRPETDHLGKVRAIVDRLDCASAFHQIKNGAPIQIETPRGWVDLADYLDELVEALDADRG